MADDKVRPPREGATYAAAGVDIDAAQRLVDRFKGLAAAATRAEVKSGVGGFAGLFQTPGLDDEGPILVAATDGVGTKLLLARQAGALDAAGQDLVAMSVNDILVYGAEPWFFLDYLAMGSLQEDEAFAVVSGVAAACRRAGCALLGGETAELPGMLRPDDLELAGFAVGGVWPRQMVDGKGVAPGQVIIGLASSGLHSNGYSLARQVLFQQENWDLNTRPADFPVTLGEALLEPTRLYPRPVLAACRQYKVYAMAHITGGGLADNLARTLPSGVRARLHPGSWPEPPIFDLLRRTGPVAEEEMRRTFNLGIGFTMVVDEAVSTDLCRQLAPACGGAWPIGVIEAGEAGRPAEVIWP